jgi:hypothetical protein
LSDATAAGDNAALNAERPGFVPYSGRNRKRNPLMGNAMWWLVVLIGLLLAAFVAVVQVKKRLLRSDDSHGSGFTLSDLRRLHREGKMTDEEFEKAKQIIVVGAQRAAERQAAAAQGKKPTADQGTDPRLG